LKKKNSKALCRLEAYLATDFRTVRKISAENQCSLLAKDQGFTRQSIVLIALLLLLLLLLSLKEGNFRCLPFAIKIGA